MILFRIGKKLRNKRFLSMASRLICFSISSVNPACYKSISASWEEFAMMNEVLKSKLQWSFIAALHCLGLQRELQCVELIYCWRNGSVHFTFHVLSVFMSKTVLYGSTVSTEVQDRATTPLFISVKSIEDTPSKRLHQIGMSITTLNNIQNIKISTI